VAGHGDAKQVWMQALACPSNLMANVPGAQGRVKDEFVFGDVRPGGRCRTDRPVPRFGNL